MRISLLLPIIPFITFTLGLPVPEPDVSLEERHFNLFEARAMEVAEYEERDVEMFDGRSFEMNYELEERDLEDSSLDFDSRSDSEEERSLYRKDSGDYLEPRVAGAIAEGAQMLVEGIMAIVNLIKAKVAKEKEMRNTWTQWLITKVKEKIGPKWNALVIHPKHDYKFAGVKGKDWYHKHFEFKNSVIKGTTTGYDLYWFKEGEVTSKGDGGFLNWCYNGLVKMKQNLGKKRTRVVFGAPK